MVTYIEHPFIRKDSIEARLYQQLLAGDVLKKGNTMIVAPTALGKTIVAVLVASDRLEKVKNSKILILSPSKPLAIQHESSFKEFLTVPCTSITGAVKTDERVKRWEESQVISATPQTVESDLLNGRYSLKDVSLIVFDECHHAVGSYSYVYLASRYVKESKFNLVLGLTASPGSDKSKIKEVCENLFIQNIVVKSEDDDDVRPYFNPVKIDWVKVKMSEELEKIKESVNKALKIRLKGLKNMGIIKTVSVSKVDILKARGRVQNRIGRSANPPKECFQAISVLSAVINIQHSLELIETQGVSTFNKYISRLRKKKTKAAKSLLLDDNFGRAVRLAFDAERNGWEHPKLRKLTNILKKELSVDSKQTKLQSTRYVKNIDENSSKIIVFTQYRDTLEMIHNKLEKEGIKSAKFFGQAAKDGEKGLTQKEQKNIIKSFKKGEFDVLISTSVAEEGIDIPAVDLVILYEPVPSEVRMIQRRGRTGRKRTGRVKVLITEGTRDEGYYWSSIRKEDRMRHQLIDPKVIEELNKTAVERMENEKKVRVLDRKVETSNKPVVYADSREGNSKVIRHLTEMEMDVKVRPMAVADYQVSDDVAIERKTAKDFVDSIMDKRLFKQATELREEFKKPLIILEGDDFYNGFINPNAVRGSIASIALDFGISIIPTRNAQDTAAMIKRIAIREQTGEKPHIQTRTDKKPVNMWEQQLFIVESLPNIGPVNAKKLLEHFGTVSKVINASENELMEVEGIGKKTAKNIRKVVDSKYLHFQNEIKDKKLI
ncbi:ATP-dependent RNA helicase DbpA [Methanobrevibacter woesei]|uniref:ATP-dependent RNA helicase DbpA n=1 Tax=Methanobrevibacter woesei TaxID=190976 RepID=A0A2U1S6R0_9EURY|nr:DEAD/DEAH box helicase [Methanobrevibacter woesei]MCC9262332.1 DEAD/DEAH box helicase [Methanobrevibacter woesei]PWB85668.1 ATP-dependent RNA helicase DbpA [Methanobrevibacter woesei]